MLRERIIPCLLLSDGGLVKTQKFKDPRYIGDPINTIHIFNEKDVDEMILVDINASQKNEIDFSLLEELASEAFMPLTYGGGVKNLDDIYKILSCGFEKVLINNQIHDDPNLIIEASKNFGAQSISIGIDVKKNFFGKYIVYIQNGLKKVKISPIELAVYVESLGAGEIFLNLIDRDGMMNGYDVDFIKTITKAVNIPVVACGGAGSVKDIAEVFLKANVSGAAVGSFFIYYGKHKAVLINVPTEDDYKKEGLFNG